VGYSSNASRFFLLLCSLAFFPFTGSCIFNDSDLLMAAGWLRPTSPVVPQSPEFFGNPNPQNPNWAMLALLESFAKYKLDNVGCVFDLATNKGPGPGLNSSAVDTWISLTRYIYVLYIYGMDRYRYVCEFAGKPQTWPTKTRRRATPLNCLITFGWFTGSSGPRCYPGSWSCSWSSCLLMVLALVLLIPGVLTVKGIILFIFRPHIPQYIFLFF